VTSIGYALPIKRLVWIGVALTAVVLYGTIGYVVLEGWSVMDALYMTITTMTTVGFREVRESTQAAGSSPCPSSCWARAPL
jgi:Ion channel